MVNLGHWKDFDIKRRGPYQRLRKSMCFGMKCSCMSGKQSSNHSGSSKHSILIWSPKALPPSTAICTYSCTALTLTPLSGFRSSCPHRGLWVKNTPSHTPSIWLACHQQSDLTTVRIRITRAAEARRSPNDETLYRRIQRSEEGFRLVPEVSIPDGRRPTTKQRLISNFRCWKHSARLMEAPAEGESKGP